MSAALPPGFDASGVRAVAMDMDRTILPSSLALSPATFKAVAAVKRAGVEPIIATGRMFASARPYALELGITAPLICYQGALVADPQSGEWLLHEPIDVPLALEVIAAVRAEGFHMNVYVNDQLCVERPTPEARKYSEHARLEMVVVGDFDKWLHQPTTKIVIVGEPHALDDLEVRRGPASTGASSSPNRCPSSSRSRALGSPRGRRFGSCATGSRSIPPTRSRSATAPTISSSSRRRASASPSPMPTRRCFGSPTGRCRACPRTGSRAS